MKLENCMLNCDVCTLENASDNKYVSHLVSGKSLDNLHHICLVIFKLVYQAIPRLTYQDEYLNSIMYS